MGGYRYINASIILLIGVIQFFIVMEICQFIYPGYSISDDVVSRLGIGPTALIFNSSLIILGLMGLAASVILYRGGFDKVFNILLIIVSLSIVGVGLFPMDLGLLHLIPSLFVFVYGGVLAIYSSIIDKSRLRYIWLLLGVATLVSLGMFISGNYMGIGRGGMERMIIYPLIIWIIGFSARLSTM